MAEFGRLQAIMFRMILRSILIEILKCLSLTGAAYQQGYLYVSGDREEWSTNSRLAIYSWQNNVLTYSGYKQMPNTSPNWWGPDGLTFNTSGDPSSYGSGVVNLSP